MYASKSGSNLGITACYAALWCRFQRHKAHAKQGQLHLFMRDLPSYRGVHAVVSDLPSYRGQLLVEVGH